MSEELRMYVEVGFNFLSLMVVWTMTVVMSMNMGKVSKENRSIASLFRWAFVLLALGDTGHVGFRVAAHALAGLESNGGLVGIGALATDITVAFFLCSYALYLEGTIQEKVRTIGIYFACKRAGPVYCDGIPIK